MYCIKAEHIVNSHCLQKRVGAPRAHLTFCQIPISKKPGCTVPIVAPQEALMKRKSLHPVLYHIPADVCWGASHTLFLISISCHSAWIPVFAYTTRKRKASYQTRERCMRFVSVCVCAGVCERCLRYMYVCVCVCMCVCLYPFGLKHLLARSY